MKLKLRKLLTLFLFLLSSASVFALDKEEAPQYLLFLGRFHPLILHLPIGAFIFVFFMDVIGRIRKDYPVVLVKYGLTFSAVFAILACLLGYFLSLEGGYDSDTLNVHFWTGIVSAILLSLLSYLSYKIAIVKNKVFLGLLVCTFVIVSVAGHFGSVMTHGSDFLTEYAETSKDEKNIEKVGDLRLYDDVVAKIIDKKCAQCHNESKRKGELSLISETAIKNGGENGVVLLKNNAIESKLYAHAILPLKDELHMPPEGKPQLTKKELWLLKYWINHGASFEGNKLGLQKNDTLNTFLKTYLTFKKDNIPIASQEHISNAEIAGFSIKRIVPNKGGLVVKFLNQEVLQTNMDALNPLQEQIVELNLSNVNMVDSLTNKFKIFKNLEKVRMENTLITDQALLNLRELKKLKTLNIYGTSITSSGLENLLKVTKMEKVFAWNTLINKREASKLESTYKTKIYLGVLKMNDTILNTLKN